MEYPATDGTRTWLFIDERRSTLARLGVQRTAALIAALVLLFIGLRCINLDADPPRAFGKRAARELVAEPAAKSHEARNYALFDTYHLNEADDYQFWRAQSPVWVYPLTGFFKTFGVDWPQLRLFSTLYAALGLLATLVIAVRFASPWAVTFIGGLVACDSMYFHYARAGLLEPAVNSWIAASVLALIFAERKPLWLLASHWALVLAFFTKQAALLGIPVVALGSALVLFRGTPSPELRRARLVVVGNALAIVALSVTYVLNSSYWRAVQHNVNHVILGSDAPAEYQLQGVTSIVTRIIADGRYRHFFATVPVTGIIGLVAVGLLAYALFRKRELPYAPVIIAMWFACTFAAMLAIAWSALRFWTLMVLPAALVAGIALDVLYVALARRGGAQLFKPVAIVCAAVLFGVHFFVLREPLIAPSFTLRDGARAIEQTIGPHAATVLGARSPPMILGTPYKNFYLRSQFNSSREQLEKLAPTHFLFVATGDGSRKILQRELPAVNEGLVPLLLLDVRGDRLQLFAADQRLAGKPQH